MHFEHILASCQILSAAKWRKKNVICLVLLGLIMRCFLKINTFSFSALTSQDHQRLPLPRKGTSQNHQVLRKLLLSPWLHSFLSLTVPSLFLSLFDCSFAVPFFSWRFLCGSFPYLTVRVVFLSSLDFSSLLFKSPYRTSEVSHIDFLWSVSSKEGPQTCANSVFCSLVIALTPKTSQIRVNTKYRFKYQFFF